MKSVKVVGKNGISARVVADSINDIGNRMVTMELEYPRFILAELNTHRMLSKNTASSRAIPVEAMHKQILENMAVPVYWGKNKPGMTAVEELGQDEILKSQIAWGLAASNAIDSAKALAELGNHKQVVNRVTEPFMMVRSVVSGTEWDNFLWLRDHDDAQPEIHELAKCVRDARHHSTPQHLAPGEWHLPYVERREGKYWSEGIEVTLDEAMKISVSCCAQVSYRKNDTSVEKAQKIFDMLNLTPGNRQAHASPTEHQATPMENPRFYLHEAFEKGVSHVDMEGNLWSGNLKGWVQYRKIKGF